VADHGHTRTLPPGDLRESLFELGVEFPCGGESRCGGCRIRVAAGEVPITDEMREALTAAQLRDGWRLGCRARAATPVAIEIAQWSAPVLTDETRVPHEPRAGLGAVVDLGTTTLVAQSVDLEGGEVESVETALNPQARHGADLMSRIRFDLEQPGVLGAAIRETIGAMLERLAAGRDLAEVLICGNTAMHHLFAGLDARPLAAAPFRTGRLEERGFTAADLGWPVRVSGAIAFLPCIGGFAGGDVLAGLIACGLQEVDGTAAFADLGTNGEIAVATPGAIYCASTAAGPAFEAGRIRMGMRAGTGAIDRVHAAGGGALDCHVIGGGEARGICGSGLVDAASAALELGAAAVSGRLPEPLALSGGVSLHQSDVRELQLAKGAVAAGLRILSRMAGAGWRRIHLAGAFGNYVAPASARRIGLLPEGVEIKPEGNTALRGTRMLLLVPSRRAALLGRALGLARHVELAADPAFEDLFAESMRLAPFSLMD
jgi:uncharacterized 2Fe-2S/4Fe-4S cluster protein (DUF4445 family)